MEATNKMPNRNLGREMGRDDDKAQDVNEQEIASDPQSSEGLGTNFSHARRAEG